MEGERGREECFLRVFWTSDSRGLSPGGVWNWASMESAKASDFRIGSKIRLPLGSLRGWTGGGLRRSCLLSLKNLVMPSSRSSREPRKLVHWEFRRSDNRSLTREIWRLRIVLMDGSRKRFHWERRCLLKLISSMIDLGSLL